VAARPGLSRAATVQRSYRPNIKPKETGKKLSEFPLVCTLM
jgi:hypothetical protein